MELLEWAKEQCRLYALRVKDDDERNYVASCCDSALKAFESLLEDGHSGMSIVFTKQILDRMILVNPLVPLEDTKDDWVYDGVLDNTIDYTHRYYSPLRKHHHLDTGVDEFYDTNRCICANVNDLNGPTWTNKFCTEICHNMFPITFPYFPDDKKYKILVEEILTDRKNGDFDTMAIRSIITPYRRHVIIDQFYKETEDGFEKIDRLEWEERKKLHDLRVARENQAP